MKIIWNSSAQDNYNGILSVEIITTLDKVIKFYQGPNSLLQEKKYKGQNPLTPLLKE